MNALHFPAGPKAPAPVLDAREFGIMLNLEQGRAQGEPRGIRNTKRAFWGDAIESLQAPFRSRKFYLPRAIAAALQERGNK